MGSGEDAQFVFAKYDYTAQGNQVSIILIILIIILIILIIIIDVFVVRSWTCGGTSGWC